MTELTDAALAELERLAGEATPGEWGFDASRPDVIRSPHRLVVMMLCNDWPDEDDDAARRSDGVFIVAACNAAGALVAEVRRLRQVEAAARAVVDEGEEGIVVDGVVGAFVPPGSLDALRAALDEKETP